MKMKLFFFGGALLLLGSIHSFAQTDAYHKGNLLLNISEGTTWANYATGDAASSQRFTDGGTTGTRDPLFIEYALTNKIGLGLTMGGDIFNVNPAKYYGFTTIDKTVKTTTSELTLDGDYHFFVTKKLDLSSYVSAGLFSVKMKGHTDELNYNYTASGSIFRIGTRARYYVYKRFGVLGSFSAYSANANPDDCNPSATTAKSYSTTIRGLALEFGVCFRVF